jgi:anti-sigma-K factor RskA
VSLPPGPGRPAPERDAELDSLLGAYALDALEPPERDRVERYVERTPAARAEVDELRETAAALALAPVDDTTAPPELWRRIADELRDELGDELAPRRARRRGVVAAVAAAAAVAVAVAVGVTLADGSEPGPDGLVAAFDEAVDEGASVVALRRDGAAVARVALLDDGTGYLRDDGLPRLADDETYQLWAVVGGAAEPRVISAGVLGPDPDAAAFTVAGDVAAFVLTVEEAPGVARSDRQPYARSDPA